MYEKALTAMKRNIFFRPMTKDQKEILLAGNLENHGGKPLDMLETKPMMQHLSCFAGGMVGIAARIFDNADELDTARKLMEGCLWVYEASDQGILPEMIETIRCDDPVDCPWDEKKWIDAMSLAHHIEGKDAVNRKQIEIGLPAGVVYAKDKRYILRYVSTRSVFSCQYLCRPGQRLLNPYSSCIVLQAIAHFKTAHGTCSTI
jgi:mannosyl-oligosaccharide alpha-1,2-mannosidase